MSSQKLKNAPLKEVIFELHWEFTFNEAGVPEDPGFEFAVGKFAEKLKSAFPVQRKLPFDSSPIKFIGVPLFQYWSGELSYPVVQHGKGMIAINEVESSYVWSNAFRPLIMETIEKLVDSYEEELRFNKMVLKYVDAVDVKEEEAESFITNQLQTKVSLNYNRPGDLRDSLILQVFELEDSSLMRLNISTGMNNQTQQKAVIWSTLVEKNEVSSLPEIIEWIDFAHEESSKMFKKMLNPDYYASLDR